jgi:hypothetical protein
MPKLSLAGALLLVMAFVACSDDDGEGPAPSAGDGGESGDGGSDGKGGCASDGNGSVIIEVTGLPDAVDADVELTSGSSIIPIAASTTRDDLDTGNYTVVATRVTDDDPIVRNVYDPVVTSAAFCLADGASQRVTVEYTRIPSSGQLWTSNLRGFSSEQLAVEDEVDPNVVGAAPIGKDVAFDRGGNLWSMGATLAEPMLTRISAGALGNSGEQEFDRGIAVPEIECLPALRAIAFDSEGNLWLAACGSAIVELAASSLTRSDDVASRTVISAPEDAEDLAFDADGNLWVAAGGKVLRYDAARLSDSTTESADLELTPRDAEDGRDLGVSGLAFDEQGSLWGFDFGSNTIFRISSGELDGTGASTVVSEVSFVIGVGTLVNRGAFDEGGGLWISFGTDKIARLAPAQLLETRGSGDPVTPDRVITSDELDSDLRVALFPAPEALPLYHTAFEPE